MSDESQLARPSREQQLRFLFFYEAKVLMESLVNICLGLGVSEADIKKQLIDPLRDEAWLAQCMRFRFDASLIKGLGEDEADCDECIAYAVQGLAAVHGLTQAILGAPFEPDSERLLLSAHAWMALADARFWHGRLTGRLAMNPGEAQLLTLGTAFKDKHRPVEPKNQWLLRLMDEHPNLGHKRLAAKIDDELWNEGRNEFGELFFRKTADGLEDVETGVLLLGFKLEDRLKTLKHSQKKRSGKEGGEG